MLVAPVFASVLAGACAQIGTDPAVPASLEVARLPFPSVAVGDSLRDTLGIARPLQIIARNLSGEVIDDVPLRYLARDSSLEVDSITGHVFARNIPNPNPSSVAARFANALQILAPIRVTNAPDTAFRTDSAELVAFLPDAVIGSADSNSVAVEVQVQYRGAGEALANVNAWLVRFAVVRPANLVNDTTASVFLVDERGRAGQVDTTGTDGLASRRMRVRASVYPAAGVAVDTVEIEAAVMRRGVPVAGAPVRILVPVTAAPSRGGD